HHKLGLFKKSIWLWHIPPLPVGLPGPEDEDFMLATDPRLPHHTSWTRGRYPSSLYPVKVLSPAPRYVENMIYLTCRDAQKSILTIGWEMRPGHINKHTTKVMEDEGLLDTPSFRPLFQNWWSALSKESSLEEKGSALQGDLMKALLEEGTVPSSPFTWLAL
ncbi:hypothetical protein BO71DRAFT_301494, partial [Aspergillus ellipticus CBS 707.79]